MELKPVRLIIRKIIADKAEKFSTEIEKGMWQTDHFKVYLRKVLETPDDNHVSLLVVIELHGSYPWARNALDEWMNDYLVFPSESGNASD